MKDAPSSIHGSFATSNGHLSELYEPTGRIEQTSLSNDHDSHGPSGADDNVDPTAPSHPKITDLVIVCGHAICTDSRNPYDESNWLLQPFQCADPSVGKPSEHNTFLQHISAGSSYFRNPSTLLVFSGGRTNVKSDLAEGFSYGQVFLHDKTLHSPAIQEAILQGRVAAECWATDSYQNLLFSIIYFWEKVGTWPESITVITHAFKQDRFLQEHCDAIRWPRDRIRVQGINPPFTNTEVCEVAQFEAKCKTQFKQDPYGVKEPLAGKRAQRGWNEHALAGVLGGIADEEVKRQLKRLLDWQGGDSGREMFPHTLPWAQAQKQ